MLNEDQMLNLKPRRKAQEWRGWYQKNGARMQSGGGKFICMATKIYRGDGSNHRRLQGKVAIITGAGSRIGEAIAHNFAKGGARSSCAGRRMPSARRRFIEFFLSLTCDRAGNASQPFGRSKTSTVAGLQSAEDIRMIFFPVAKCRANCHVAGVGGFVTLHVILGRAAGA
jgi:hypothetical protein